MKRVILFATIALLATGAGLGYLYAPTYQAQQDVKTVLTDPDSAKFSGITVNRKNKVACGYVNAKNRMGGYVGNTGFIVFPDGDIRLQPATDAPQQEQSTFRTLVDSNCKKG